MCAHSGDTPVRISIQGTLAIVPWMPVLAGTLATDESAKEARAEPPYLYRHAVAGKQASASFPSLRGVVPRGAGRGCRCVTRK
jgi:hypothetical protein